MDTIRLGVIGYGVRIDMLMDQAADLPRKREEWTELVEKCEWEWITYKGTKGQKVTGPNGNSIFFPAAGHRTDDLFVGQGTGGEYWSGTLYEGSSLAIWYNGMAYLGAFSAAGSYMIYYTRDVGRSVRAVLAH